MVLLLCPSVSEKVCVWYASNFVIKLCTRPRSSFISFWWNYKFIAVTNTSFKSGQEGSSCLKENHQFTCIFSVHFGQSHIILTFDTIKMQYEFHCSRSLQGIAYLYTVWKVIEWCGKGTLSALCYKSQYTQKCNLVTIIFYLS